MKLRWSVGLAPLFVFLTWGMSATSSADYSVIGEDAEPLRADFNADIGKVRVLMLVAPT